MKRKWASIPTGLWLALFPATFILHFAEEFWGGEGYPAYLFRLRGVEMSDARFVALQGLAFVLLGAGVIIAQVLRFREFMALILGSVVFANGMSHTLTAIWDGGYGPGLVMSFVWIVLGVLTYLMMWPRMSRNRFLTAAGIGIAINGIVAVIALVGGE